LTIFAGMSGNPWPREKPWLDTLPLDVADDFPTREPPVVKEESDRPGIE
jgi:hypothetical protein